MSSLARSRILYMTSANIRLRPLHRQAWAAQQLERDSCRHQTLHDAVAAAAAAEGVDWIAEQCVWSILRRRHKWFRSTLVYAQREVPRALRVLIEAPRCTAIASN